MTKSQALKIVEFSKREYLITSIEDRLGRPEEMAETKTAAKDSVEQ